MKPTVFDGVKLVLKQGEGCIMSASVPHVQLGQPVVKMPDGNTCLRPHHAVPPGSTPLIGLQIRMLRHKPSIAAFASNFATTAKRLTTPGSNPTTFVSTIEKGALESVARAYARGTRIIHQANTDTHQAFDPGEQGA